LSAFAIVARRGIEEQEAARKVWTLGPEEKAVIDFLE
jgi:hypothetical protein